MKRTLVTLAVGHRKYRLMALAMMQSAREASYDSIDRYVMFSDSDRLVVPSWLEVINVTRAGDGKFNNWVLKPWILSHPSVADDLILFLDADSTVFDDVIRDCFDWIEAESVLLYMNRLKDSEDWGGYKLHEVYERAGFPDLRNLSINSGIIGVKPDQVGNAFRNLFLDMMSNWVLIGEFDDPMYSMADEPYAGLAYQLAFQNEVGEVPETSHRLKPQDYMITVGAAVSRFYERPGPVIDTNWCDQSVTRPAIVHWVSATQYLYYRLLVWKLVWRSECFSSHIVSLFLADCQNLVERTRTRLGL